MNDRSIFLAAMEFSDSTARKAYLDDVCSNNKELRNRVEELLAASARSGSFMTGPAVSATLPTTELLSEGPGTRVGPYKLLQQIGEGGMGVVFMAEQEEPVRRKVALKIIKPGMDSKQVIARFEAERQALSMMDHPNIARVLDAGMTATGRPYFVMELVHGVSLTEYCDANKLSPHERLALFVPVCQAIQHAHMKGIIHRDIKPSNILVTMYDDKPVPKVIDFGIAKAVEQRLTQKTLFTQFGSLIGTYEYMSPEQAEMNAFGVDTRSDVYSLGVLLYELLTGSTPLERQRLRTAALGEVVRLIKEEEAPKPSQRISTSGTLAKVAAAQKTEPGKLSAMVRGELDWIVMRCLEKDRTRRYETANGLARDVQRYLNDEIVEARPPSAGYRLKKFVRRHKGQVIAASLVLFALVGGIAGTTFGLFEAKRQAREADRERSEAIVAREDAVAQEKIAHQEQQRAEREAKAAQAVRTFLSDDLLLQSSTLHQAEARRLGGGRFKVKTNPTVRELLDRAAEKLAPDKLEARFPGMPLVQAEVLATVGASYLGVDDYKRALDYLDRSVATFRANHAFDAPAAFYARERHALAITIGDEKAGAALIEDLLKDVRRVLGEHHRNTFMLRFVLARLYTFPRRADFTESDYQRLVDDARGQFGEADSVTLYARCAMAIFLMVKNERVRAIREMESVRSLAKQGSMPLDHPDFMLALVFLANAYRSENRVAECIEIQEEVLGFWETNGMGADPETRQTRHLLGWDYFRANRFEEAVKTFQKNVPASLPPYDVMTSESTYSALMKLGRHEAALAEIRKSLELYLKRVGKDHHTYTWGRIQARIGDALAELNRNVEAEGYLLHGYNQMVKSKKDQPPYDADMIPNARMRLYSVYRALNRIDDANRWAEEQIIPELKKEVADLSSLSDRDTPENLKAAVKLASFYKDNGRQEEAVAQIEATLARGKANGWPLNSKSLFSMQDKRNGWPLATELLRRLETLERVAHDSGRTDLAVGIAADVRGQLFKDNEVPKYIQAISSYSLGLSLAMNQKAKEAEEHLQEALRLQLESDPNSAAAEATRLQLGIVLVDLKNYAEAEPLLLKGYEGMKQREKIIPTQGKERLPEAVDRLVELYTATNKPDEAKKWQAERAKYPPARAPMPREVK